MTCKIKHETSRTWHMLVAMYYLRSSLLMKRRHAITHTFDARLDNKYPIDVWSRSWEGESRRHWWVGWGMPINVESTVNSSVLIVKECTCQLGRGRFGFTGRFVTLLQSDLSLIRQAWAWNTRFGDWNQELYYVEVEKPQCDVYTSYLDSISVWDVNRSWSNLTAIDSAMVQVIVIAADEIFPSSMGNWLIWQARCIFLMSYSLIGACSRSMIGRGVFHVLLSSDWVCLCSHRWSCHYVPAVILWSRAWSDELRSKEFLVNLYAFFPWHLFG